MEEDTTPKMTNNHFTKSIKSKRKRHFITEDTQEEEDGSNSDTTYKRSVKKRRKGLSTTEMMDYLDPFYFMVTSPFIVISNNYMAIRNWLVRSLEVDGSDDGAREVVLHIDLNAGLEESWRHLQRVVLLGDVRELLKKFLVVEDLLKCKEDDYWEVGALDFVVLKKDLWWIDYSRDWFRMKSVCIKNAVDYINIAFPAMVLELWYRFIWARHILNTFENCQLTDDDDMMNVMNVRTVALFFNHPHILKAIDDVEAEYFDSGNWDISPCITKLVALTRSKYKIEVNEEALLSIIENIYERQTLSFLEKSGIYIDTSKAQTWEWNDHLSTQFLVDVLIPMFQNITDNGTVSSSEIILNSFPNLFLLADARSESNLAFITDEIEYELKETGILNEEIEQVMLMLDQLVDERDLLTKDIETLTEYQYYWKPESLKYKIYSAKLLRVEEVDNQIELLRDELHNLTISQDIESDTDLDCKVDSEMTIETVIENLAKPTF